MEIQELFQSIVGKITQGTRLLVLEESDIASPQVKDLLSTYFEGGALSLNSALLTPDPLGSADTSFSVSGHLVSNTKSFVVASGTDVLLKFYIHNGQPQIILSFTLPDGWKFTDSFPALTESIYSSSPDENSGFVFNDLKLIAPKLVLDSLGKDGGSGEPWEKGLNFHAELDGGNSEALAFGKSFFSQNLTLTGPIDTSEEIPLLNLIAPIADPAKVDYLGTLSLELHVTTRKRKLSPDQEPAIISYLEIVSTLPLPDGKKIPIALEESYQATKVSLNADLNEIKTNSLSVLGKLVNHVNIAEIIPEDFKPDIDLALIGLSLTIDTDKLSVDGVSLWLKLDKIWNLAPSSLSFVPLSATELFFNFALFQPTTPTLRRLSFSALATISQWVIIPGVLELSKMEALLNVSKTPDETKTSGYLRGVIALGNTLFLETWLPLPLDSGNIRIAAFKPLALPDINTLSKLLGGGDFSQLLPKELNKLSAFTLIYADLEVNLRNPSLELLQLTIGTSEGWNLVQDKIVVRDIVLTMEIKSPTRSRILEGGLSGTITLGLNEPIDIHLNANYQSSNQALILSGSTSPGQALDIGELIGVLANDIGFDDQLPSIMKSLVLQNFSISFNTYSKDFSFTFEGSITDPVSASLIVNLKLTKNKTGRYEKHFAGQLSIGKRRFDLIFDSKNPGNNLLLGVYQKPGGENVSISALLAGLLPADVSVPAELAFSVKNALLVFDSVKDDAAQKSDNKLLFTSEIDFGINLSGLGNLPLVGQQFSGAEALTLAFQPVVSSKKDKKLTDDDIKMIRGALPDGCPALPDTLGEGGLGLLTTLRWGSLNKTISLGIKPNEVDKTLPKDNPIPSPAGDKPVPPPGQTQWTDLKKNIGALNISRVGLSYANSEIKVLLDGGVSIGPLSVALAGFGAAYNLSGKTLSVSLDGLGLSFAKPPLEISGAFIRMDKDFAGRVTIKAESFAVMALGAFSEYNGHPSFFLYAFLDYPLGGPAFFFVEGLALGFGYNRRLEVPPVEQLRSFPLISEVIGEANPPQFGVSPLASTAGTGQKSFVDTLRTEFETLGKYIYPQEGQYFIAAGIKFNSFKTIDSFALLTIGFGQHLDFGLMGVSKLTVPAKTGTPADGSVKPVAEVEMAFSVRFDPEEGFLAVQAVLTPNSYILSGLCKIQGGFAFFSWFKGPNAGDFVVTLGGYHPHFAVPAHYPQPAVVPRLSYMWRISDDLFLKGSAYFAMTPKAMMAGGRLEAAYKKEFDSIRVEANFTATADFLIFWKPFHYEASASVEISASITLMTFLGDWTFSLSAGADVQLWGPPFAGTANVHVKVIGIKVEFTVDFGGGRELPAKLSWKEFKKAFLPENPEANGISIAVQGGLVQSIKQADNTERWVINPKEFKLALSSIVPLTTDIQGKVLTKSVLIDPVVPAAAELQSQMTFVLTKGSAPIATDSFAIIPVEKQFPKALWTDTLSAGSQPNINGDQMIGLTGGYLLMPKEPSKATASHFFLVGDLDFNVKTISKSSEPAFALTYPGSGREKKFIKDEVIADARAARRTSLSSLGFDPEAEDNLQAGLTGAFVTKPQVISTKFSNL